MKNEDFVKLLKNIKAPLPFEINDKILEKSWKFYSEVEEKSKWEKLEVIIFGEPKAWKRERVRVGAGRQFLGMFDPNYSFKKIISDYVRDAMEEKGIKMIYGPVKLFVEFYKPMPKSLPPYKGLLYEAKLLMPTSKPDVDNYIKQVQDALNNITYGDDAQIILERSAKYLSYQPRMEITMEFLSSNVWK